LQYDFFWITDHKGRYGLYLKTVIVKYEELLIDVNLKGVSIVKKQTFNNLGELFIILTDQVDWELFFSLCIDLLNVSKSSINEYILISSINFRLKKWQKFLSQNSSFTMPLIQQMGLYTELLCLKDIISSVKGIKESILSWVGPNFDKQDFSLNDLFIEVKSYISSKGPIVKISSLYQLDTSIKPLILLTYGVTLTSSGCTIINIINDINSLIKIDDLETADLFENKLAEYGFINGITKEPFYQFTVDKIKAYLVSENFPRIVPIDVKEQIISVNYSIDLSKCHLFEINPFIF
jgi:hypothetical protein